MKILFVTRKYPPSTGGMENMAYELSQTLNKKCNLQLVKSGVGNKWLPIVYPWLLANSLFKGIFFKPDVVYIQDGVMAPLGLILKTILRKPTMLTIHGLEVTFNGLVYRKIFIPAIKKQNSIITVSDYTKKITENIGAKVASVIPNGVEDKFFLNVDRNELIKKVSKESSIRADELKNSYIIFTSGRLVKRKGVAWFVANVMPELREKLDKNIIYFVSGVGPEEEIIKDIIQKNDLHENVILTGRISDKYLRRLYNLADLFIMPNIPVANDVEGFGLVALEASSCGTTVVASNLEGITGAVRSGKNGFLIKPKGHLEFSSVITQKLKTNSIKQKKVRDYTLKEYSWMHVADLYIEEAKKLLKK